MLKVIAVFVTLYLIDLHYVFYTSGFWAYPIFGELAPPFRLLFIDLHYVFYASGFWAYPILGELAPPFRLLFIAACMFIVYLRYVWLSLLPTIIHGADKPKNKKKN